MTRLQERVDKRIAAAAKRYNAYKARKIEDKCQVTAIISFLVAILQNEYITSARNERGDVMVPAKISYVAREKFFKTSRKKLVLQYIWPGCDPDTGEYVGEADSEFSDTPCEVILQEGLYLDRLGDDEGTYVSPSHKNHPIYNHEERGLPYLFLEKKVEMEPSYHRYKVVKDFSTLLEQLNRTIKVAERLNIYAPEKLNKLYHARDTVESVGPCAMEGIAALCFDGKGGCKQYRLPCPIWILVECGMIQEE